MIFLARFKRQLEATSPKSLGWNACIAGVACALVAGLSLVTKGGSVSPTTPSTDAFERFLGLWIHYLTIPQAILGLGLILFGSATALRREWGRQGLLGVIRLVFLSLFVLMPVMGYAFFIFFRDKWIPSAVKGGTGGGFIFGYGTAVIFGAWSVIVAVSMFWWVALLIKRLKDPDYQAWTTSPLTDR